MKLDGVRICNDPSENQWSVLKYSNSNNDNENDENILMSIPHDLVLSPLNALLVDPLFAGRSIKIHFSRSDTITDSDISKESFILIQRSDNNSEDTSETIISLTDRQMVMLTLCRAKRDPKSRWHEYVTKYLLHTEPLVPILICSDRDLKALFTGSPLATFLLKYRKRLKSEFDKLHKQIAGRDNRVFIEWDEYLWADCMMKSRAFRYMPMPRHILKEMLDLDSCSGWRRKDLEGLENLMDEHGSSCMFPLLDLMNHSPDAHVKLTSTVDGICARLPADSRYSDGQELFCNYGPKGNEELLMSYGFCIDPILCPSQIPFENVRLTLAGSKSVGKTIYLKHDMLQLDDFISLISKTMEEMCELELVMVAYDLLCKKYSDLCDHECSREYQEYENHKLFKFVTIYRESQKAILQKAIMTLYERLLVSYKSQLSQFEPSGVNRSVAERDYAAGEIIVKMPDIKIMDWKENEDEYDISLLKRILEYKRSCDDISEELKAIPVVENDFLEMLFDELSDDISLENEDFQDLIKIHQRFRFFDSDGNCKGNYFPSKRFLDTFRVDSSVGNVFITHINGIRFCLNAAADIAKGMPLILVNANAHPPLDSIKRQVDEYEHNPHIALLKRSSLFKTV